MATIVKLLKRHWLPLGAFVLIFALLSWLLQPRPRESYTFGVKEEYSLWGYQDSRAKILSPSGRYICFRTQDDSLDQRDYIHVFDILTKTFLFKDRCGVDKIFAQPMFTANDELIYSAYYPPDTIKLSYWKPGDVKPRMIYEYVYPIAIDNVGPLGDSKTSNKPQIPDDTPFNGLLGFDYTILDDRTLSPDGLTWLVINKNDRLIYLDFIDSRTGERKGRLDLPPINLDKKAVRGINVAFDPRGRYLLVKLWHFIDENEKADSNAKKEPTVLYWFDVATGKMIQSKKISQEITLEAKVLWMDLKQVTFLGSNQHRSVLLILNLDQGYQQIAMNDTDPNVIERTLPRGTVDLDKPVVEASTYIQESSDQNSSLMIYKSLHILTAKQGNWPGETQTENYRIGCRDIRNGQLLFTKVIELDRDFSNPSKNFGISGITPLALPGPWFVLKCQNDYPDWVNKPESWRYKLAEWIPSLKYQLSSTFLLYDPYTGHQKSEITIAQQNILTQLSADQLSFTALGKTIDDHYQCLIFDYPFHKPWLFIFYWAAAVAFMLLILQTAMRFFTSHAKHLPKQRSVN